MIINIKSNNYKKNSDENIQETNFYIYLYILGNKEINKMSHPHETIPTSDDKNRNFNITSQRARL